MNTVGIVGSTSPLGIEVCNLLLTRGYKIRAGYRASRLVPPNWWENPSIRCVFATLENRVSLLSAFERCDIIIWLAHCQQQDSSEEQIRKNVLPFSWFCSQLPQIDVKKLILVSSGGAVYGEATKLPIPEHHDRHPLSFYGKTKKQMEDVLGWYTSHQELQSVIIRPGNIYGTTVLTSRMKGVIPAYLKSLFSRQPFISIGGGTAIRDFIHSSNVATAILLGILCQQKQVVWNVGTGVGHSILDILKLVSQVADKEPFAIIERSAPETDVKINILSIEKIKRESNWHPDLSIEAGITNLVQQWETLRSISNS